MVRLFAAAYPIVWASSAQVSATTTTLGPGPFVSSRFVTYNTSDCNLPWTFIQTEKLGDCYYSGPTSWSNNCSADGSSIERTYWEGNQQRCAGVPENVTTIATNMCAAYFPASSVPSIV